MLERTSTYTELIHSVEVVVNILPVKEDGILGSFVIGEDGVWSLTTSLLSDISWVGMTSPLENVKNLWILRYNWEKSAPIVVELAIMLKEIRADRIL
jgi:hypothetical protein